MSFTSQAGLSISQNKIQLVEIVKKDNNFYLENVDEEYFEESVNESTKEAKFIHILQNSFNEIILRKPLTSNKISITLPPSFFKIFELPVDKNLTKNDLNDYIQWELTKLFPNDKPGFYSHQKIVISPLNIKEIKRVIVFAISKNLLKRIHKFCVRNSLQLKFIDNGQIASNLLLASTIDEKQYFSIYLEDNILSAILYFENQIVFQKSKAFNSISEIPEILNALLKEIKSRTLVSEEINKIHIDGNLVNKELKNYVENLTDFTLMEIQPFEKFSIDATLENNNFVKNTSAKFSSPTAIALRIAS